ncbi:MAG: TolC family protein [Chromatiales bacterium]|nr:TolC family protein [Chromatiales bacterium]
MRLWWCVVALVGLSACSSMPKSYTPQGPVESAPELWQGLTQEVTGKTDLLSLVPNTAIEPWLDKALVGNPGLRRMTLELAEAGWITRQERAGRLPNVSLVADASRKRETDTEKTTTTTGYGLALSASWELDVWGRLADSQNASELDESALAADFLYAQRSLAANFIKRWLTWVNGKQLLAVEEERLKTLALNEMVVRRRYQLGLGSLQDLETARTDAEQAVANVAVQEESVAASQRQLQELLGVIQPINALLAQWPDIDFPRIELPAYSMGQRPDLIAAYQRIQAADKRSVVAYKNLLPGFTLSVDLTQNRASSGDLLTTDPGWLLLGSLTQPLFQGGRLRAELKAAEQRAGQAYWAYRESLLAALLEVEAGLSRERNLKRQYEALNQALTHAQTSQRQFEQRYRQGLASILDLLNAQQTTFDIRSRVLQVALDRANNRIDLGLALGLPIKKGA